MKKFICSLFFQGHDTLQVSSLLAFQVRNLGFKPNYLKAGAIEIQYDLNKLIEWIENGETSVRIMSEPSINSSINCWAYFEVDRNYNISNLTWCNVCFEFLIETNDFVTLLSSENFIYGACYNMDDAYNESATNIEYIKNVVGKKNIVTTKDQFDNLIVDVSRNCGRKERINGLEFIAAPIMWFGNKFNEFIPWRDILKFSGSEFIKTQEGEYVLLKLFDLSDDSSLEKNRKRQCQFWEFFNLQEVIKNYEKRTAIDLDAYMKDLIEKKKKKRNNSKG
ncbi:MAG: hypothetical protein KF862_18290 [Chitinophagaceae bacterium]|nr:hypothetical protein [Chitinophagaceae bacterium]